ncbi:tRNA (adenosine(37)-N6)-dimethylallyltransferase MiaA [Limnohabitans sp. B9-3]|uniref:tRNA (adenosine(37)-N6)-dimethylallyltransferase MiaA n=1 Tax=Limnohabitans sp. B9-3 TaxID=1100707 RepID=UPI000C1EE62F|nr:tRNA (adenosine(37)-N6)-dimethylallyltransferase MiaA [Limnohabitans sp. B9-3]PIT75354.1 tRNA (adenosine(37)-N6)-dimethylallyltransferase MiaA [Limnohabitans sp. B9-3]
MSNLPLDAIALLGPTASGKTAAALAIAQWLPIEIISLDSALVYRGMDIGTAKPSAQELAQVPHHLIDIRDPLHAYSAAEFARDATDLIADIRARGKLPLVVGGTMLYLKALRDGIDDLPTAQPELRAQIEDQAIDLGWPGMHAELAKVDPVTAARLAPNDAQRISRALEVWRVSGKPLSQWFAEAAHTRAQKTALNMPLISLEPSNRAWLHERVGQRFDAMLKAGFMDEMLTLRGRGDLHIDLPSMRCVGYRQAWELLERAADFKVPIETLLPQLRELGTAATRQLAKRQLTWLRGLGERLIVPCDAPDALAQTQALVKQLTAASL